MKSKITTEQKGFLRKMLDDISENKPIMSTINEEKQQDTNRKIN